MSNARFGPDLDLSRLSCLEGLVWPRFGAGHPSMKDF